MSKINTSPRGLQNLLGNINQGVNPAQLEHSVRPGVDLVPFWSTNKLAESTVTGAIAGTTGQRVLLPIPEGEAWLLLAASCEYELASTNVDDTSITIGVAKTPSSGVIGFATSALLNVPGQTGEYQRASITFPQRIILTGGWSLCGYVDSSSNPAARTMVVRAFYVNLVD